MGVWKVHFQFSPVPPVLGGHFSPSPSQRSAPVELQTGKQSVGERSCPPPGRMRRNKKGNHKQRKALEGKKYSLTSLMLSEKTKVRGGPAFCSPLGPAVDIYCSSSAVNSKNASQGMAPGGESRTGNPMDPAAARVCARPGVTAAADRQRLPAAAPCAGPRHAEPPCPVVAAPGASEAPVKATPTPAGLETGRPMRRKEGGRGKEPSTLSWVWCEGLRPTVSHLPTAFPRRSLQTPFPLQHPRGGSSNTQRRVSAEKLRYGKGHEGSSRVLNITQSAGLTVNWFPWSKRGFYWCCGSPPSPAPLSRASSSHGAR